MVKTAATCKEVVTDICGLVAKDKAPLPVHGVHLPARFTLAAVAVVADKPKAVVLAVPAVVAEVVQAILRLARLALTTQVAAVAAVLGQTQPDGLLLAATVVPAS